MRLTDIERDRMLHALGWSERITKEPYRNHYAAGPVDVPIWLGLCERGLAREGKCSVIPDRLFHVTPAGRAALQEQTP